MDRAMLSGIPLSRVSRIAISSAFFSSASASFHMRLRRTDGFMADHGPLSKARRAAWTARSISAAAPAEALAKTSPVAGLMTSNVSPDRAGTNLPSMNNAWVRARKLWTRVNGSDLVKDIWTFMLTPGDSFR